jgi:hypothetical protein
VGLPCVALAAKFLVPDLCSSHAWQQGFLFFLPSGIRHIGCRVLKANEKLFLFYPLRSPPSPLLFLLSFSSSITFLSTLVKSYYIYQAPGPTFQRRQRQVSSKISRLFVAAGRWFTSSMDVVPGFFTTGRKCTQTLKLFWEL